MARIEKSPPRRGRPRTILEASDWEIRLPAAHARPLLEYGRHLGLSGGMGAAVRAVLDDYPAYAAWLKLRNSI